MRIRSRSSEDIRTKVCFLTPCVMVKVTFSCTLYLSGRTMRNRPSPSLKQESFLSSSSFCSEGFVTPSIWMSTSDLGRALLSASPE